MFSLFFVLDCFDSYIAFRVTSFTISLFWLFTQKDEPAYINGGFSSWFSVILTSDGYLDNHKSATDPRSGDSAVPSAVQRTVTLLGGKREIWEEILPQLNMQFSTRTHKNTHKDEREVPAGVETRKTRNHGFWTYITDQACSAKGAHEILHTHEDEIFG